MSQILNDEFEDFFQKIQLGNSQRERIESAVDALTDYLSSQYELTSDDVFVQGSFSTNTAVRPAPSLKEEGEYDVDLVIFSASREDSPNDALESLENTIANNGTYKNKIEKDDPKIPCVRLRYADEDKARFHVDIVPALQNEDGTIEVPRRDEAWETSDPISYMDWVTDQGDRYSRTLMMLKRWRDENQVPIKSIVLQVITAECLSDSADDSINLSETLQKINIYISELVSPPELHNPVFYDEILTARWKDKDFADFKELVAEAAGIAGSALEEEEHDEAASLWQKILGEDFIFLTDKQVSLGLTEASLGNISHAKPLIFPYRPTQGVSVTIRGFFAKPWTKSIFRRGRGYMQIEVLKRRYEIKSGQTIPSKGQLDYYAKPYGLSDAGYEIHWQVVNTGDEATRDDGLRGTFFTSRNINMPEYNYEETRYEGTHWIECFIVKDKICVARSGRFYITIRH